LRPRSPSLLALLACTTLLLLPACNGTIHDDPACRGVQCLVGSCEVVGSQPRCVCNAFDQALDEACDLIDVPDIDDAGGPASAQRLEAAAAESASVGGVGLLNGAPGDLADYFSFDARRTTTYWFRCAPAPCEAEFVDAELRSLGLIRPSVVGSSALFKAKEDGRAYVQVRAGGQPLRFTYQLESLGADDYPDAFEQRNAGQQPALTIEGRLESSLDTDIIAVATAPTTPWEVNCDVTGPGLRARVVDETGRTLAVGSVWDRPSNVQFTVPAAPGAFLILEPDPQFRDPNKPEVATHYRCSVKRPELEQDVRVLSQVGHFSDALASSYDWDRYEVSLSREGIYEVRCPETSAPCSNLGASQVPEAFGTLPLRFFKAAGEPLSIYVRGRAGAYTLELVEIALDDYDAATFFPLPPDGTPLEGQFLANPGDIDNFSFQVEDDAAYRIEFSSPNGASPWVGPELLPGPASARSRLYDDGTRIWLDTLAFSSGEQHLRLAGGEWTRYLVSVRRFPADDHPDYGAPDMLVDPDLRLEGSLYAPIDEDWFLVDLEARPYTAGLATSDTPFLVSLWEVSGDSALWSSFQATTFQPPRAGRYAVRIWNSQSRRDPLSYQVALTPLP
jgi:hypothetical protein